MIRPMAARTCRGPQTHQTNDAGARCRDRCHRRRLCPAPPAPRRLQQRPRGGACQAVTATSPRGRACAAGVVKRWGTRLHAVLYRLTRGRLLGRVGGQQVLLLETVGRRTGRARTTPVQYLADGATFVVVAANGGRSAAAGVVAEPVRRPARTRSGRHRHPRRRRANGRGRGARGALAAAHGRQSISGRRGRQGGAATARRGSHALALNWGAAQSALAVGARAAGRSRSKSR